MNIILLVGSRSHKFLPIFSFLSLWRLLLRIFQAYTWQIERAQHRKYLVLIYFMDSKI